MEYLWHFDTGHGSGTGRYEIQLHYAEGAHYPTGSLYSYKRAPYPKIEPEVWFPFQMVVKDKTCLVRINGATVMQYDQLENLEEGSISLQAYPGPGSSSRASG